MVLPQGIRNNLASRILLDRGIFKTLYINPEERFLYSDFMGKKKEGRKQRVLRQQASRRLKKGKTLTDAMQRALGSSGEKK